MHVLWNMKLDFTASLQIKFKNISPTCWRSIIPSIPDPSGPPSIGVCIGGLGPPGGPPLCPPSIWSPPSPPAWKGGIKGWWSLLSPGGPPKLCWSMRTGPVEKLLSMLMGGGWLLTCGLESSLLLFLFRSASCEGDPWRLPMARLWIVHHLEKFRYYVGIHAGSINRSNPAAT